MPRYDAEELAVLRELAYEERAISTRLFPKTLEWKAQLYRPLLTRAAEAGETLTYRQLTSGFGDSDGFDVRRVLGIMGLTEDRFDRPLLPAVVVEADTERPGDDYFSLVERSTGTTTDVPARTDPLARRALWETHKREVWAHDWS